MGFRGPCASKKADGKNAKSGTHALRWWLHCLGFRRLTMRSLQSTSLRKTLIILLILLAEYTLFGFILLPMLLRHFGEKALQEHVTAGAVVEKVKMNPFTMRLEVIGLELPNADGDPWVTTESAVLDLSMASVFRWYPVVDELTLQKPYLRIVREATEKPDVSADEEGSDWREAMAALGAKEIPEFELHRFSVAGGHVEYSDPTGTEAFEMLVDPLDFTVLDFSSADAEEDSFSFAATTPSGTSIRVEGSMLVEERVLLLDIQLEDVQLDELSPYYTDFTNFAVKRAVFGTELDVRVDFRDLDNCLAVSNLNAELKEVLLERLDDDNRIISLDRMTVEGMEARFPEPEVHLDRLRFENGATRVARDSDGNLNLVSLFTIQSSEEAIEVPELEAEALEAGPGLAWSIGSMEIEGYSIQWEDRYGSIEADTELMVETFILEGLSDNLDERIPIRAAYRFGEEGVFVVDGRVALNGTWTELNVQIDRMPLVVSGPYLREALGAGLESGTMDMLGQIRGGPEEGYNYSGLLGINACRVTSPVQGIASIGFERFELEGDWEINVPSALRYEGDVRLRSFVADIDQMGEPMEAKLGQFDWAATVAFKQEEQILVSGDGALASLALRTVDTPMIDLGLERFEFAELELDAQQGQLALGSVALSGLDGQCVLLPSVDSEATVAASAPELVVNDEVPADPAVFAWELGRFSVTDGAFRVEDRSFKPAPVIELSDLGLELSNLSSVEGEIATLDLKTKVNKSPFTITGTLAPTHLKQATSLQLDLVGLALPPFSPYSGAAVGRKIENGIFTLEGDWTVEGSQLKARNQLRLDGFKFGERVPDPAVSLPLDLALTLLRRPDGSISLSLPLSGDLSDPKASIGGIIISAFTNIIMKATTAPFGLIANMMGSEQDISKVEFQSRFATLSPDSISALNLIAKALEDRPGLKIKLAAEYTEGDVYALKEAALREALTGGKEVDAEVYAKRLRKAYLRMLKDQGESDEAFSMETAGEADEVQIVMVESTVLAEDALALLCASREDVVFDFLTEVKGVDASRVSLSGQVPDAVGELSAVRFELSN